MQNKTRVAAKKPKVRIAVRVIVVILVSLSCIGYIRLRSALAVQTLVLAIKHDNLPKVKAALDKGANPNALVTLANGWDGAAYEESKTDLLESLIDWQVHRLTCETPLMLATEEGKDDIAQLLILRGADVRFSDGTGSTPLMWAAYNGDAQTVQMLVNKGADVNSRWKDGTTVIGIARGRPEILAILKRTGAKE